MTDYIKDLRTAVQNAASALSAVSPEAAEKRPASGGWCAKEVIGHLIDSASNNHQRFVRGQIAAGQDFPRYEQEEWVRL